MSSSKRAPGTAENPASLAFFTVSGLSVNTGKSSILGCDSEEVFTELDAVTFGSTGASTFWGAFSFFEYSTM